MVVIAVALTDHVSVLVGVGLVGRELAVAVVVLSVALLLGAGKGVSIVSVTIVAAGLIDVPVHIKIDLAVLIIAIGESVAVVVKTVVAYLRFSGIRVITFTVCRIAEVERTRIAVVAVLRCPLTSIAQTDIVFRTGIAIITRGPTEYFDMDTLKENLVTIVSRARIGVVAVDFFTRGMT